MSSGNQHTDPVVAEHWRGLGDRTAQIFAPTGETLSYAELEMRTRGLASRMRDILPEGDHHVAALLENDPRFLEIVWAAIRAGLHVSGINWHLPPAQAAATVASAGSRFLFASATLAETASAIMADRPDIAVAASIEGVIPGFEPYEALIDNVPTDTLEDVRFYGEIMFFSSGSTGVPKGIRRALTQPTRQPGYSFGSLVRLVNGVSAESVCYSPAPLYHLSPLGFLVGTLAVGGTVVVTDRFDPERTLAHIERYRVTHINLVPTMMIRIMKLPDAVRLRYDLSSLRSVFHGAGPCPIPVKRAMIEWLGPILIEGYGGSEMIGTTRITSEEWLAHPGSVGRRTAGGYPVILDDKGNRLPPREVGRVFFADAPRFELQGADKPPVLGPNGEQTFGDLGWMDEDGYLYITERADFVINSGGVKVMPQDIEAELVDHPAVADVVVVGAAHHDLGEAPVAIVELAPGLVASESLADELKAHCADRLVSAARPRAVCFARSLPRAPTGKLYAKPLRDAFKAGASPEVLESLSITGFTGISGER